MSKYQRLTDHLVGLSCDEWTATFSEIEAILQTKLPQSAYSYPAWWSNQIGQGHSQSASWQSAGWRAGNLNLSKNQVTFSRQRSEAARPSGPRSRPDGNSSGLTISEAKAGLAAYFGVSPEAIEITIKG